MQANKVQKSSSSGYWYSLALVSLFFVIVSFYANQNEEIKHDDCNMQAKAATTEGLHQLIPGLWQVTF